MYTYNNILTEDYISLGWFHLCWYGVTWKVGPPFFIRLLHQRTHPCQITLVYHQFPTT